MKNKQNTSKKKQLLNSIISLALVFVIANLVFTLLQQLFFMPIGVIGPSMTPTLPESDSSVMITKSSYEIERGDVVVVYRPLTEAALELENPAEKKFDINEYFRHFLRLNKLSDSSETDTAFKLIIKRVIGISGDTIRIEDSVLYVNGVADTTFDMVAKNTNGYGVNDIPEFVVGEDLYFIMGDNRNNSLDSEDYYTSGIGTTNGCIPSSWVFGKAIIVVDKSDGFKIAKI